MKMDDNPLMKGDRVTFQFRKVVGSAKLPNRKRVTDAGYDVFAIEDITIPASTALWVGTGIQIAAPPGYYFTLDGRSGMGKEGIQPFRGIIDSGYTGEMSIMLYNYSTVPYEIKKGDRIAQLVAHKQIHVDFEEVEEFSPGYNNRGPLGWGSSGK